MATPLSPQLTETRWQRICPLLPAYAPSPRGGRPREDDRACLEGILWVLRHGARWRDLPETFPSAATCWRRLRNWERHGAWDKVWWTFLQSLTGDEVAAWAEALAARKNRPDPAEERQSRERRAFWHNAARGLDDFARGAAVNAPPAQPHYTDPAPGA
jgi:transposase